MPSGQAPDVLSLSRETGQDVLRADGRALGRLADLTVRLGATDGAASASIDSSCGAVGPLTSWCRGRRYGASSTPASCCAATRIPRHFAISSTHDALRDDELLLLRDVLDTQVVDVVGQRLARVADVVLTRTADDRLELGGRGGRGRGGGPAPRSAATGRAQPARTSSPGPIST